MRASDLIDATSLDGRGPKTRVCCGGTGTVQISEVVEKVDRKGGQETTVVTDSGLILLPRLPGVDASQPEISASQFVSATLRSADRFTAISGQFQGRETKDYDTFSRVLRDNGFRGFPDE